MGMLVALPWFAARSHESWLYYAHAALGQVRIRKIPAEFFNNAQIFIERGQPVAADDMMGAVLRGPFWTHAIPSFKKSSASS
jgi:hypothetical protein